MIFRKMDMISPPITIFYKGDSSHSSVFSGILTFIVYFLCFAFGIQYAIKFFNHTNPKVYNYNRYVEDAGEFPLNSSQIFNFIQIYDTSKNLPDPVDFDSIRIIGLQEAIDLYEENNDLTNYNHWIYGPCNNSTDTQGISELINFDYFTESACIRYYYNKDDKKYYNTDDNKFIWPDILHGCSHPNRTFYGIILEKCRNDTLRLLTNGKYCKTKELINKYIKKSSVNFQLIDNYADVLNYEKPFLKYFYSISNGLFDESYTTNHLNFNPITLITNDAIFMDSRKETVSYYFQQNEKVTSSSKDTGIYVAFYFWMQNRMQYYERQYSKFQDALSDIGGIGSLLLTLSYIINFIVSNFVILLDTEGLLNEIESSKKFEQSILKNNIYKNLVEKRKTVVMDSPPKKYSLNLNSYRNHHNSSLIIEEDIINENNENEDHKDNLNSIKITRKRGSRNNRINIFEFNDNSQDEVNKEKERNSESKKTIKNDKSEINLNIKENKIIKRKRMDFLDYITYLFTYKKFKKKINCYEEFRCRIISEENLILSYLNICKILKLIKKIKERKENEKMNSHLDDIRNIYRTNLKRKTLSLSKIDNIHKTYRNNSKRKTISYK